MKNVAFHTQIFCILSFRFFRLFDSPGAREYTYFFCIIILVCRHSVASRYLGYTMNRFLFIACLALPSSLLWNCPHKCLKDTDTIIMYSLPWGQPYYVPFYSTSFSFLSITINIINALIVKVAGGIESFGFLFLYSINNDFYYFSILLGLLFKKLKTKRIC